MFYDEAKILIKSGAGGDGMISFRREKHVPRGGPNGGDGGKGGDVIVKINPSANSLIHYHRQSHFRADDGKHGQGKNMTGAMGDDLYLEVPPGTLIHDETSGTIIADLTDPADEVVLLHGGRGGRGNSRFKSSTHQAPRIAERGEPGQESWILLELKLIADIGIVGVPNAGKSTLLSAISAARPKIADYPFTTLQPNLGVVEVDQFSTLVFADIPGLIEGAASGAGLGHDFLRHIERTRVLVHLLDGNSMDPLEDWAMINQELALYDAHLETKPQLVVLNKIDLPDAIVWKSLLADAIEKAGFPFEAISAVTGSGVRDMIFRVKRMLEDAPVAVIEKAEISRVGPPDVDDSFTISHSDEGWRVEGRNIERVAAMTYWEFEATTRRFQQILDKMGISSALKQAGITPGDTVLIGDEILEWSD